MLDVNKLYFDEKFNGYISFVAMKKRIRDYDDFRQDIFLEILNDNVDTMKKARSVINKVSSRYYRKVEEIDLSDLASGNSDEDMGNNEEFFDKLVYHNKARYV